MIIREASEADASYVCKISCEDLGYSCNSELVKSRLSNLDKNREAVFVAQIQNNVVGYIHVEKYNTLYFESMVNILGLAVSADYRRKGIGKALLNHTEDWARKSGINYVRLNSGITRKQAHNFYRAMGYDNEKGQIRFMKHIGDIF